MKSLSELMSLKGRVALVTGGAGLVGTAICESLAELGADLVVLDFAEDNCRKITTCLQEKFGVEAHSLLIDLEDEEQVRSGAEYVQEHFGKMDILVNCAALIGESGLKGWTTPFEEQSSETWRRALEVNLTAPFILTQACSGALAKSGHGSIINIGSIYGMVGPNMKLYENTSLGNPAAYAASKGGLLQLTRWLATVLAPDIRANCISLGGIRRNQPDDFHQRYVSHTPLGRMAAEEDLKGTVCYLASDLSAYVTGHNLVVDGGWTIW